MSGVAGRTTQTWRKLRLQCFKRDKANDARCTICGGRIDYSAKPSTTPESWEPDHRLSVKHHPELAEVPENVLASHKSCNRSKGDRAGLNNLGAPSREW